MNTYRYYSDLHGHLPDFKRDTDSGEICIVAGDLAEFSNKGVALTTLIEGLCERFKEVIFVPGNHEYYGTSILQLIPKLKSKTSHLDNFVLLQDGDSIERDGVTIIGATMWSDVTDITTDWELLMNDHKYIRHGTTLEPWKRKLRANDTTIIHMRHVDIINKLLQNIEGPSIVITHHAPSSKSIDPRFEGSALNPAYSTDIELDKWPTYWIHGHIHRYADYKHNGCRVLCNPGGYQSEYTDFKPLDNHFEL